MSIKQGLDNIIPPFKLSNYFVYFNSLREKTKYNSSDLALKKQNVLNQAKSYLGQVPNFDAKEADKRIINAFNFLQAMAQSERNKELAAIKRYKEEILNKLPDSNNKTIIEIKKLIAELDNAYAGSIDRDFYLKLTALINTLRKEYEDYKNQLNLIKREADEMKKMEDEYSKSNLASMQQMRLGQIDMSYKTQEILGPILNEWGKGSTQGSAESLSGLIKAQIYPFFRKKLGEALKGLRGDEDIVSLLTGIYLDFQIFLQNKINKNPELWDATRKNTRQLEVYITNTFQEYKQSESLFLKSIKEQTGNFYNIMDSIKNTLHIKAETKMTDILKSNVSNLSEEEREIKNLILLNDKNKEKIKLDKICNFSFSVSGKGMNGNLQEIINTIIATNVGEIARGYKGNIGGDILTIKIGVNINDPESLYSQRLHGISEGMDRILSQLAKNQGKKNQAITTELIKQINREANNLIKHLETEMISLGYIDDIFIFHESDKLYSTMVTNRAVGGRKEAIFHGRNLSMLSYINEMYAMNGLGGLELMQEDVLKFLTANLSTDAVAAKERGPLEKYFSIFAGILMFDDIILMAQDVQKDISNIHSTTKQVHLYNFNGVYVPASLIMQATYNQLMQVTSELDGLSAEATIHVPSGFQTTESKGDYYKLWIANRDNALQNTRIEIILFASFIQFIQDLFNYT